MKQVLKEVETRLSPLESDVLRIVWSHGHLKVRQIHDRIKKRKSIALTSVAVALDRLHKQGIVDRTINTGKGGLSYVYFPLKTKKEFEKKIIEQTVNSLLEKFGSAAAAYFNENFANSTRPKLASFSKIQKEK